MGSQLKQKLEQDYKKEGRRNAIQVISNGLTGAVLCLLHHYYLYYSVDGKESNDCPETKKDFLVLYLGYIAHFACCTGDTWASELGILSSTEPFLITNFHKVPKGTNGGKFTILYNFNSSY